MFINKQKSKSDIYSSLVSSAEKLSKEYGVPVRIGSNPKDSLTYYNGKRVGITSGFTWGLK